MAARVDVLDRAAPSHSFWCFGTRGPHRICAYYCLAHHCADFRSCAVRKSWGPAHSLLLPAPSVLHAEICNTRGPHRIAAHCYYANHCAKFRRRAVQKSWGPAHSWVPHAGSLLFSETCTTRGPERKAAFHCLGKLHAKFCSRLPQKSSGPASSLVSHAASLLFLRRSVRVGPNGKLRVSTLASCTLTFVAVRFNKSWAHGIRRAHSKERPPVDTCDSTDTSASLGGVGGW